MSVLGQIEFIIKMIFPLFFFVFFINPGCFIRQFAQHSYLPVIQSKSLKHFPNKHLSCLGELFYLP